MTNKGKKFEHCIKEAFLKIPEVSVDRIPDQTMGYKGAQNICDFIVYKKPYEFYIECKSVHGNTLPFSNITETQWQGLLEKSKIKGVFAGVICWWIDKDVTKFIPIQLLEVLRTDGYKSVRYDYGHGVSAHSKDWRTYSTVEIKGKKKRVFFDYDMDGFFHSIEKGQRRQV